MKKYGRISWRVLFVGLSLWCLSSYLFAQNLGGALNKTSKRLDKAKQTAKSAGSRSARKGQSRSRLRRYHAPCQNDQQVFGNRDAQTARQRWLG